MSTRANLERWDVSMATATIAANHIEPLGLVVRDGEDDLHRHPRILMYFWASEEEVDEEERRDR